MIRVFDDGGKTASRYTVVIGEDVFAMSTNANMPDGVNQYCCKASDLPKDMEQEIALDDLPKAVLLGIINRMEA